MTNVLVVGSSNTDMVVRVRKIPSPGQTVMGDDLQIFAGGKGANQAVAARRAGGEVRFVAAVGDDDFGQAAIAGFREEGIHTGSIEILGGAPSGVAMIFVSDEGENCIGVAPGANNRLSRSFVESQANIFPHYSHLLVQLEIPMDTVEAVIQLAHEHGVKSILNPAPAADLSDNVLSKLYCITPNESEAMELTGLEVNNLDDARAAAQVLLDRGVENVILTLGSDGALLINAEGEFHQAAPQVEVVDTTAAGDTFNGILATCLAEGAPIREAMCLAVAGASLSVQRPGATDSVPRRHEFDS